MADIDGLHECPKDGCTVRLPFATFACRPHWYSLKPATRARVNDAWYNGDHGAYLAVREEAVKELNHV